MGHSNCQPNPSSLQSQSCSKHAGHAQLGCFAAVFTVLFAEAFAVYDAFTPPPLPLLQPSCGLTDAGSHAPSEVSCEAIVFCVLQPVPVLYRRRPMGSLQPLINHLAGRLFSVRGFATAGDSPLTFFSGYHQYPVDSTCCLLTSTYPSRACEGEAQPQPRRGHQPIAAPAVAWLQGAAGSVQHRVSFDCSLPPMMRI